MSIVRLHDVDVSFEGAAVLRDVFLKIDAGDRIGLIGRNGSGKSTILKLVLGEVTPDTGTVDVSDDVRIGYFSQFSELTGTDTVVDALDEVFADIRVIEAELSLIEESFGAGPDDAEMDRLIHRQAALLDEMEHRDGWSTGTQIDTVLTILGFSDGDRARPVDALSGGWRNRAALAKILLQRPDVLLLDEPTNYLDVEGLEWLEGWLQRFRGAVVVVSHDRHFLDQVIEQIIEIENLRFHLYDGNFTQYVREKPLRLKSQEKQFLHEAELLVLEAEGIKSRADRAKANGKGIDRKLANVKKSKKPKLVDQIVTDIYGGLRVKDELCTVDAVTRRRDDRTLFENLTFHVRRRERIGIVGPNGCGKSSLVDVLVGEQPDDGEVRWARGARFAYFNQLLDDLDLNDTVTHAVNAMPDDSLARLAPRKQVNRFLTLFQFSEMDQKQRIGTLSGGQRARVALAQCLLSGATTIILDEPTNHLDVTSTQVMERALTHFPGAVIVVSHDRFFLDKVATRRLSFTGDGHVSMR